MENLHWDILLEPIYFETFLIQFCCMLHVYGYYQLYQTIQGSENFLPIDVERSYYGSCECDCLMHLY